MTSFEGFPTTGGGAVKEAVEHMVDALGECVDWMKRYRCGDKKLHPEEFFIRTEEAERSIQDWRALADNRVVELFARAEVFEMLMVAGAVADPTSTLGQIYPILLKHEALAKHRLTAKEQTTDRGGRVESSEPPGR